MVAGMSLRLPASTLFKALLLAWFLLIQSYALIHNAHHGFTEHKHNGIPCLVYDYGQHQNLDSGLPTLAIILPILALIAVLLTFTPFALSTQPLTLAPARAPPSLA
jgi:hypothetical protein